MANATRSHVVGCTDCIDGGSLGSRLVRLWGLGGVGVVHS